MEDSEKPSNSNREAIEETRVQQFVLVNYLITELATEEDVRWYADWQKKNPHEPTIESARHYAKEGQLRQTAIFIQLEPELSLDQKTELLAQAYEQAAVTRQDLADHFDSPDHVLSDYKNKETVRDLKRMFRQESQNCKEIADQLKDLTKPTLLSDSE